MYTHPCKTITLHIIFFLLPCIIIDISASKIAYSDQCSSFVPEPTHQTLYQPHEFSQLSIRRLVGYYTTSKTNKNLILTPKKDFKLADSVSLSISSFVTDLGDLYFGVNASLGLHSRSKLSYETSDIIFWSNETDADFRPVKYFDFKLRGFWSKSDGKLCAVGDSDFPVLFKLFNFYNSSSITNLVTGSLESITGSYFDLISMVLFPKLNYEYTLSSQELITLNNESSSTSLPLNYLPDLCSFIFKKPMKLRYASRCRTFGSVKNCSPLGDLLSPIPDSVMLQRIECFDLPDRLRLLVEFSSNDVWSHRGLDPKSTLIGEGIWDSEKNLLFVAACRIKNATKFWTEARMSDCSIRLSLRFPSFWSISDTRSIVGHVWSVKSEADSGFFEAIGFHRYGPPVGDFMGTKFEYTVIEKAKSWCSWKKPVNIMKRKKYPFVFSNDMRFDVVGKMSGAEILIRGNVEPVFVGEIYYNFMTLSYENVTFSNGELRVKDYPANVTYQISLSSKSDHKFDITAEGIYDVVDGRLCMVGCRNIVSNSYYLLSSDEEITLDCDVVVDFHFPAKNSREGYVKGSIESKRKESDPLYFEPISLSSAAFVSYKARDFIQAIDFETFSILFSNTMACAFVALQICHLKRNSGLSPLVSVTVLVTLALGHIAPTLGLIFSGRELLLGSGRWDEAQDVIENLTESLLFLFQARLLWLTLSSRLNHEDRHAIWTAEKKALVLSLPLYFGGVFVNVYFSRITRNPEIFVFRSPYCEALNIYADGLLDWFLVPQVLFDVIRDSKEKPLSRSFYAGTTLVRVICRVFKPASVSIWDTLISLGCLIFAAIVYLQHKFGGRFGILLLKIREFIIVRDKVTGAY